MSDSPMSGGDFPTGVSTSSRNKSWIIIGVIFIILFLVVGAAAAYFALSLRSTSSDLARQEAENQILQSEIDAAAEEAAAEEEAMEKKDAVEEATTIDPLIIASGPEIGSWSLIYTEGWHIATTIGQATDLIGANVEHVFNNGPINFMPRGGRIAGRMSVEDIVLNEGVTIDDLIDSAINLQNVVKETYTNPNGIVMTKVSGIFTAFEQERVVSDYYFEITPGRVIRILTEPGYEDIEVLNGMVDTISKVE
ncbi:MAG: hypothetical protein ABH846_01845 [Patescibacteria group bacterium]